jgi:DNA-binding NarL/FixJ family response regulator
MERGRQGLDLGADVIMMKSQPASILLAIIDSMVRNATPSHGDSKHFAAKRASAGDPSTQRVISSSTSSTDSLTEREREVVALVSKGLSNRDIAERLCITETTVRHHLTSIFDKLGVSNRQKLLLLALERGLNEVSASA